MKFPTVSASFCSALAAAAFLLPVSVTQAQMTFTPGDLLVGFQATGGGGSGSTYVYNLGSGTAFRDGTRTGVIATIGADLNSTFGTDWFARNNIYWGIAGVRDPAGAGPNTVVDGDPRATIYVSRAAVSPGLSDPWLLASGPTVVSTATSISSMQTGFRTLNGDPVVTALNQRTPTAGSDGRGVVQSTGDINSWNDFNPVGGAAFGGVLTGGVQMAVKDGAAAGVLDLYRVIGRASAGALPNSPVGEGVLLGSFSINAAGEISFALPSTNVNPFQDWADSFGLSGLNAAVDADPDGDGMANGIEFVVGGNPVIGADSDKLPFLLKGDGTVDFVYPRSDAAEGATVSAEFSVSLEAGSWIPAVGGTGGVTVTVEEDGFGTGTDRVTVRVPSDGPVRFARLRVVP